MFLLETETVHLQVKKLTQDDKGINIKLKHLSGQSFRLLPFTSSLLFLSFSFPVGLISHSTDSRMSKITQLVGWLQFERESGLRHTAQAFLRVYKWCAGRPFNSADLWQQGSNSEIVCSVLSMWVKAERSASVWVRFNTSDSQLRTHSQRDSERSQSC